MSAQSNTKSGTSPADPVTLSTDDAFHLLQNARRRAVLRYLLEHEGESQFAMRDIAEQVAAWEHDTTVSQLSSDERQRVYIALYQNHLPKLDDQGIIQYNQPRGVVEPEPRIRLLQPFLEDGLWVDVDLALTAGDAGQDSRLGSVFGSLLG
jgi:DNA primase